MILIQDSLSEYGEFIAVSKECVQNDATKYLTFLNYCANRLEKGDSVQAIWNSYHSN